MLKTHKIPNIDKLVCCAEQKIAYNLAFSTRDHILRCGLNGEQAVAETMKFWHSSGEGQNSKYNSETIHAALAGGLENYLKKPFIASNYEQIGKAFPLLEKESIYQLDKNIDDFIGGNTL